jgi:hypothetical protein
MSYQITVNDEQARVLQDACELYARMAMGQFNFLAEMPQLAGLASDLRMQLMPAAVAWENSRRSIDQQDPATCRA